jgi:hypothetical protein
VAAVCVTDQFLQGLLGEDIHTICSFLYVWFVYR